MACMTRDVVVVGGGIAGLAAAWRLRHRDVVLLETGDRLGGRMRSDPRGEYWLNYGAHLFPAPGTLVDRMTRECGLETVPVTGSMMGLAVGSKLLNSGPVETYPFRLPLSLRDRIAFVKAGLRVRRGVARYNRLERRYDFEDDRTFGELPAALGRELGDRARTRCHVHAIQADGAHLIVHHSGGEVRARHVIMAVQAPYAAPLVSPIAAQTGEALSQLTYGAFLNVAVETNETTPMPYDDVYAMATPGRVFDMFTNQANALRGPGPRRRPGGSLMLFGGAHGAAALMHESDEVIVERFLADLHDLYPQTRGVIAGATVQRWELGNVYARPGRGRLQPMLEGALAPHQNLHLAGDYFAELGNIEAAAQTGLAAAERVDTMIREVTP
jgi:oxygen-dependent protoporphyrinogen oxidase